MRNTDLMAAIAFTCGCGGAPFGVIGDTPDAGDENVILVMGDPPDAASEPPPLGEMKHDAAAETSDAVSDATSEASSSACTPYAVSYDCYNNLSALIVPEPSQYCFSYGPLSDQSISQLATPQACQCLETFSCTCIIQNSPNFPCATQPECSEAVSASGPVLNIYCPPQ